MPSILGNALFQIGLDSANVESGLKKLQKTSATTLVNLEKQFASLSRKANEHLSNVKIKTDLTPIQNYLKLVEKAQKTYSTTGTGEASFRKLQEGLKPILTTFSTSTFAKDFKDDYTTLGTVLKTGDASKGLEKIHDILGNLSKVDLPNVRESFGTFLNSFTKTNIIDKFSTKLSELSKKFKLTPEQKENVISTLKGGTDKENALGKNYIALEKNLGKKAAQAFAKSYSETITEAMEKFSTLKASLTPTGQKQLAQMQLMQGQAQKAAGPPPGIVGKAYNWVSEGFTQRAKDYVEGMLAFSLVSKAVSATVAIVKAGTVDAMEAFRQWDYNMGLVAAKAGGTAEELKQMGDATRKIGMDSRFSAIQASEALKVLVEMGLTAKQSLIALPTILKFASIEEINMADASDILLGIIRGFGMPLEDMQKNIVHVGDVIAFVSAKSATDIFGLGQAFKVSAGAAAIAGQSIEDIGAILGTLSNAMIRGENAGFALAQIMGRLARVSRGGSDIIDETGGSLGRARSAMHQLGITAIDPLTGKMKSLIDIFSIMSKKGVSLTQIIDIFGIYTYKYAAIAVLGAKNTEDLRNRINGLGGAANETVDALQRMSDKINETYDTSVRKMKNAATGMQISLGERWKPFGSAIMQSLSYLFKDIEVWASSNKILITDIFGAPKENEKAIVSMGKEWGKGFVTAIDTILLGMPSLFYRNAKIGIQKTFLDRIPKDIAAIKPIEIPTVMKPDLSKKAMGILPSESDMEASYKHYTTAMQEVFSRIGGMSPIEAAFNKKNIDTALEQSMASIQAFNNNKLAVEKATATAVYNAKMEEADKIIQADTKANKLLNDAYTNGNAVKLEADKSYTDAITQAIKTRQDKEIESLSLSIEAKLRSYASVEEMEEQSKLKRLSIVKELYDGMDVMTNDAIKAQKELSRQTIESQSKLSISHILMDDKSYIDALVKIKLVTDDANKSLSEFLSKVEDFSKYGANISPLPGEKSLAVTSLTSKSFTISQEELKSLNDYTSARKKDVTESVNQIKTNKELLNDLKIEADGYNKNKDLMLSHISQVSKMSDLELKLKQEANKKEFGIFLQQASLLEITEKEKYDLRLQALHKFTQDQESVRLEGEQRRLATISQPISNIEGGFSKYFKGNKPLANELKQYQEAQLQVQRDIDINKVKYDDDAKQKLSLIWKSYYVQLEDLNRKWAVDTGDALDGIKEGLRQFVEESKTDFENFRDLAKGTAEAASSTFSDLFFDTFTGKMKSAQEYFKSFGQAFARIISDMAAKAMVAKFLDFSGFGAKKLPETPDNSAHIAGISTEVSLDAQLAGTLSALTATRASDTASLWENTTAQLANNAAKSGGGYGSMVSAGSFGSSSGSTGAVGGDMVAHQGGLIEQFHNGGRVKLQHDEVPAILQTKERVLSREQNKNFEALMKSINKGYTPQYKKGYFHSGGVAGNKDLLFEGERVLDKYNFDNTLTSSLNKVKSQKIVIDNKNNEQVLRNLLESKKFHSGGVIQSFDTGGAVPNWSGIGIPFGGSAIDYANPKGNVGIKPTAGGSSGMSMGGIMAIAGASMFIASFIMAMMKKKPKKEHPGMSEYYVKQHEGGITPSVPSFHNGNRVDKAPLGNGERILSSYNFDSSLTSSLNKVKSQKIVIDNKNNEQALRNLLANNKSMPRFHNGLNPDEFSGVLQKGERVISNKQDKVFKDMSKYVANRQNEKTQEIKKTEVMQNVNFNVNAMDSRSFGQYLHENRNSLAGVMKSMQNDNVRLR